MGLHAPIRRAREAADQLLVVLTVSNEDALGLVYETTCRNGRKYSIEQRQP